MRVRVFSVGFGPGLDSMSLARSRRSASHAAGTHGWLPQKTGRPGLRRGGVGGYNLHSVPRTVPPTVALWHTNHEQAVSVWCSTIWSPNASETNIDKLQIVQNTALRIATGCTHDTNTQHLHDETNVLPIHQHLQLHASQIRQKAQHPTHPLHNLTIHTHTHLGSKNKQHSTTSTTPPT